MIIMLEMKGNKNINRNWEQNEEFFTKVKKQMVEFGAMEYLNSFENMGTYIRWKGKEDSAKHSGKSMLRITFLMIYYNY